jgi:ABC-2 type transport system permease protein
MTWPEQLRAALVVEWLKFRVSPVPVATTLLLVVGLAAVSAATLLAPGQEGAFAAKAATMVPAKDWNSLFTVAGQISAVGGLIAFGVVAGWIHGREFSDQTIFGLYALPVSRPATALAKLILLQGWAVVVAVAMTTSLLLAGSLMGLGAPGQSVVALAARLGLTTLLTSLLAVPCALVATLARGYLAAVGAVVALVVMAQVAVMVGVGGWFPFAAPGLWATSASVTPGPLLTVQLAIAVPVGAIAGALTMQAWRGLTL